MKAGRDANSWQFFLDDKTTFPINFYIVPDTNKPLPSGISISLFGNVEWDNSLINDSYTFHVACTYKNVEYLSPIITLNLSGEINQFFTDSWTTIVDLANQGLDQLKQHYQLETFVGLEREIVINNVIHKVRVIGENHDYLADSESLETAALTFEFSTLLSDALGNAMKQWYNYSSDAPYYNIWFDTNQSCFLRDILVGVVKPMITAGMGFTEENCPIKDVIKTTAHGNKISTPEFHIESVWSLSMTELFQVTPPTTPIEGSVYEYYNNQTASHIKYDVAGNRFNYWLRSPECSSDCYSWTANINGDAFPMQVLESCAISPCFCL